jgi:CRISPR-associated endoribonuclease Cas6
MPLMKPAFETFHLNKMNTDVRITAKILSSVSFKDMTHQYYFNDQNRMVKIKFMTPTAFKSEGAYVFVPTLKLILRSLMHKYSDATNQVADVDEDMLQTLLEHTQVIGYNFRSTMHHLENVKIPAFIGEATIKVGGPQGIVNYLNLLFRFGSFSGVGIKCSIGMGAVDIVEKDNKIDSAV